MHAPRERERKRWCDIGKVRKEYCLAKFVHTPDVGWQKGIIRTSVLGVIPPLLPGLRILLGIRLQFHLLDNLGFVCEGRIRIRFLHPWVRSVSGYIPPDP